MNFFLKMSREVMFSISAVALTVLALVVVVGALNIVGCASEEDYSGYDGVISMKGVNRGWGSSGVPPGHPQILIDPDCNYLVKNEDVEKFKSFNGGMRLKRNDKWELQPSDLHGGKYHKLERTR